MKLFTRLFLAVTLSTFSQSVSSQTFQKKIKKLPEVLRQTMNDDVPEAALMAAEAACYLGEFDLGVKKLLSSFKDNSDPAFSSLETLTWYPTEKESRQEIHLS